jgi:hypothetical protein
MRSHLPGPHPYPAMLRDFQCVTGKETRAQLQAREGRLPDSIYARALLAQGIRAWHFPRPTLKLLRLFSFAPNWKALCRRSNQRTRKARWSRWGRKCPGSSDGREYFLPQGQGYFYSRGLFGRDGTFRSSLPPAQSPKPRLISDAPKYLPSASPKLLLSPPCYMAPAIWSACQSLLLCCSI